MSDQELYDTYKGPVYRLAAALTKRPGDAHDVVQDVFCTYLQKKPVFKDQQHAAAWFETVTVQAVKNAERKAQASDRK